VIGENCSFGFTSIDELKTKVSAYFAHLFENCSFGTKRKMKFENKCDKVKMVARRLTGTDQMPQ